MYPIGLCSLIVLAVVVERFVSLRRYHLIPNGFLPGLRDNMVSTEGPQTAALDYCKQSDTPVGHIFTVAIKRLGQPIELLEKHVQEAGEREVIKLRKYLRLLSVIVAIAPLLGLLGTIFGMINAFQTVATSAEALGKTELLAKGIYEAMITTAGGLLVAIPTLVGYHAISAKIDRIVCEIDRLTLDFIEEYVLSRSPQPSQTEPISLQTTASSNKNQETNGRDERDGQGERESHVALTNDDSLVAPTQTTMP